MNRITKHIRQTMLVLTVAVFVSCNDYLDVQPEDKFLESRLFSTPSGIENALNGIYLELAGEHLYGGELTMTTVDLLAQYYRNYSYMEDYVVYDYNAEYVKASREAIWGHAYANILNANKFIENLNAHSGVLVESKERILQGEALAIRAMLHLDMLRLFGPVYSQDSTAEAIPYYQSSTADYGDLLPAYQVMELVLADLDSAAGYLSEDPIISSGKQQSLQSDGEDFYRYRNWRMNYYAVKALQARALLYAGHTEKARQVAGATIAEVSTWFSWVDPAAVVSAGYSPDRTFSPEVIFGLYNPSLYDRYDTWFSPEIQNPQLPLEARLAQFFENNENDYRYNPNWKQVPTSVHSSPLFFKYADVQDAGKVFRFMQPLIRMSELYYIAAETESDPTAALQYLNTVRYHRGLVDLAAGADINGELLKEYRREFYGEGQLFFYYKRKNIATIPSMASIYLTVAMGESKYVVPLPDTETQYR